MKPAPPLTLKQSLEVRGSRLEGLPARMTSVRMAGTRDAGICWVIFDTAPNIVKDYSQAMALEHVGQWLALDCCCGLVGGGLHQELEEVLSRPDGISKAYELRPG